MRNLVPAGAEPHDWEPNASNVADINNAAIFVYNGAGFEHWADKTLQSAKSSTRVDIEATAGCAAATRQARQKPVPHRSRTSGSTRR